MNLDQGSAGWLFDGGGFEIIVDRFLQNLEKYRTIVHGNGGRFIVGIQGFNKKIDRANLVYDKVHVLYGELLEKAAAKNYIHDFTANPDIRFVDSCHSSDESSAVMAKAYA